MDISFLRTVCFVPRESPYIFSKLTRFMRTPRYHGQFFCFVPEESPNIFSKFDHLVITDSFFALSLGKALTFSLNSPCFMRTPHYHGQFFCFVPEESPNIFSKFDHLVITDSFFALSLGKALTFSLNSTRFKRTPVNTDNGHLHLAQSTDFHRKPTTSMRTLHYQLCKRSFLFEG